MMRHLSWILLSLAFTGIGLAGGWYASRQTSRGAAGGHEAEEEEHAEEVGHLSPQALKNLGVTFADAALTTHQKYIAVPAIVEDAPGSARPLFAPVAGRVLDVNLQPGTVVASGTVVVTLLREAIPPPQLVLTQDIFAPANEGFHVLVGELRKGSRNVDLIREELARLEKFTESGTEEGLPIVPRKNLIDLRYELARGEKELANARAELGRHGCSEEQVAAMEAGKPTPAIGQRLWQQALEQNGLWTPEAQALHDVLPVDIRDLPWVVSAIGELAAAGRSTGPLAEWLREEPEAGTHFAAIASLLQQGSTLTEIRYRHELGALEPVFAVKAPVAESVEDWDLVQVLVRPGERVEAGTQLAVLHNARRMVLRAEAAGGDAAALVAAFQSGAALEARPLVAASGPELKGLKVLFLRNEERDRGTVGIVPVPNKALAVLDEGGRGRYRTWELRSGQRYLVRLPVEVMKDVFVVPADAVTEDGPDKIVFLRDGEGFKAARVVVLHQDHEVAVLDSKDSEVFEGDTVVQHGAFALGLALKAGSGAAADAHAGHGH